MNPPHPPVSRTSLPPKREKFAQLIVAGKSASEAYRQAFSASRSKSKSVHELASRLMRDIKVTSRLEELRKPVIEEVQLTLAKHLRALAALRDQAVAEGNFGAAVTAEIHRGKASGLYVEKVEGELNVTHAIRVPVKARNVKEWVEWVRQSSSGAPSQGVR